MSGIVILEENIASLRKLGKKNPEDLGILIKAILDAVCGEEPDESTFPDSVDLLYPIIKGSIDRMRSVSEKKSAAGRAGNRSRWESQCESQCDEQCESPEPIPNQTNTEPSIEKEEPSAPRKSAPRFTPPTVEQVEAYASQHGLVMDCTRFVDWYASKGWKVGSSPMKDWQAAARNWASRDKKETGPPKKPKVDYKAQLMGVDYGDLLRRG